jgi:hypothetical protein
MQAIDKKTGILMEVWSSSKKSDEGSDVMVSLLGFRYHRDELEFPEQTVEPQRIWAVLENGHEFDDLDAGESSPVFLSTDRMKARSIFNRLVIQARQQGLNGKKKYGNDYYEEDEDNNENTFCYYLGKWCYTYRFEEYLLDSERVKVKD